MIYRVQIDFTVGVSGLGLSLDGVFSRFEGFELFAAVWWSRTA